MKNKLTFALLFAGLFLSLSAHADNCSDRAGQEVSVITFDTDCPMTTTIDVGGEKCILERKARAGQAEFICVEDSHGSFLGGPWEYTGAKEVTTPPVIPVTPIDAPVWQQPDLENTNTESYFVNSYNALVNITGRLNSITDYLSQDSNATRTEIRNQADMVADNNRIHLDYVRGSLSQIATNTDYKVQTILNRQVRLSDFQLMFGEVNTALAEAKEAQDVSDAERDALGEEILTAVEDVKSQVVAVQGQIEDSFTREAKHNELLSAINNSSGGGGDGELTVSILGDISNTSQLQLGETMDGFQAVKSNIQNLQSQSNNNTDRIVNAVNNPTGLVTVTNELQAVGGKLDGLLGQGQGLSNQLGQQLNDIKTAVENIETGGGTGGPATDAGTHERLDTLNTKVSQLNESVVDSALNTQQVIDGSTDELLAELVAIKDALENGSSEYDDTEINEKLTALINNTGATGNNVVTSGQATQQAVAASGQQVTDAVNALGNAFEAGSGQNTGPTLCTGDECYKGKSWVTPKYPEGMTSIYETHKAAFQDSSVHEYLQGFNPIISGNAPTSWQFCIDVGFANLGCHSLELPPYILSFVRLIILITAGFLCRRLIFGG